MKMTHNTTGRKVFTAATVKKPSLHFFIVLFILLFILHLWVGIDPKSMMKDFILYLALYFLFSKFMGSKIITDTLGISYQGFLKKVRASWNEVLSIKQSSSKLIFKVKTQKGEFSFPLTINEKNATYPKLKVSWKGESKWVYQNGVEEEITLENCPLYIEMQKYIDLSELEISIKKRKERKILSKKPIYIGLFITLVLVLTVYSIMLKMGYPEDAAKAMLYFFLSVIALIGIFVLVGRLEQ
jgi:hypothetical protein